MSVEQRPRSPGIVYTILAVALVVVVAIVALTARQTPPPTIAEFAPQAQQQIKDAPHEQSSQFGSGAGDASGEGAAPTPTPPPGKTPVRPKVDAKRVRHCFGDPPRQTEDPQSPPCVSYWEGDNGGATSTGVSRDDIRIFVPTGNPDQTATGDIFGWLFQYFNDRFEFYGRKLTFVAGPTYPNAGMNGQAAQLADADAAASQNVFASLRFRTAQGYYYHESLARQHILSVTGSEWGDESSYLSARRPYLWTYSMETDLVMQNLGQWACRRLNGQNATHAGTGSQGNPRKFGILMQTYYAADKTTYDPLVRELSKCGVTAVALRNPLGAPTGDETQAKDPQNANNALLQMKSQNVTTIFCICQPYANGAFMSAATNQVYFPEWILSTYGALDTNWGVKLGQSPSEQMSHAFGLSFSPRQVGVENEPHEWAVKEENPAWSETNNSGTVAIFNFTYRNMLVLASGIQMAGPKLTPQTFEAGLQRTIFPNPDHPNRPGHVGFTGGRYAMTQDGAEWWWGSNRNGAYDDTSTGSTICYVDKGKRYAFGEWPTGGDPFFAGTCEAGLN